MRTGSHTYFTLNKCVARIRIAASPVVVTTLLLILGTSVLGCSESADRASESAQTHSQADSTQATPAASAPTRSPSGATPPRAVDTPQGSGNAAAVTLARPGEELTRVTGPPERTIAAITVPQGFSQGSFDITFEPYGLGPQGQAGPRLVIAIDKATPDEQARKLNDLSGSNALVSMDSASTGAVRTGGRYTATLVVRATEDKRGELFLQDVKSLGQ